MLKYVRFNRKGILFLADLLIISILSQVLFQFFAAGIHKDSMINRIPYLMLMVSSGILTAFIHLLFFFTSPKEQEKQMLKASSVEKKPGKGLQYIIACIPNDNKVMQKCGREINIDDLLGREPVKFDVKNVGRLISEKVILVTGAGGSIGSELCRQIAKARPNKLIILDIYENTAYALQQELKSIYQDKLDLYVEIVSICDEEKMHQLFDQYRPNIVFHAAAHKQIPLMEKCPIEAIKNNIFGTYNVITAANQWKADKFILISTDEAVNPTNMIGATKRFCEMILQSMKRVSCTEYITVRLGNVLGSNGSVIPLFQRQIEMGGPLTITDTRMVRYVMTIPEAAQLVLLAGALAKSSETYILNMGKPVKILDLAEKLIRLSGYEPYTEIAIVETGLRAGEKIYEELHIKSEEQMAASNQNFYMVTQKEVSPIELHEKMRILQRALDTGTGQALKRAIKIVIPNYKDPEEINNKKEPLNYTKATVKNRGEVIIQVG